MLGLTLRVFLRVLSLDIDYALNSDSDQGQHTNADSRPP
jgi:hypothetical protein